MAAPKLSPGELLQQQANAHAVSVLNRVKFPVPEGISDDAFAALMDVIVQQLVSAWGAGYFASQNAKRKRL